METLDIQLRVPGLPSLDQATRTSLMTGGTLRPLPLTLRRRLLGEAAPQASWLAAQVHESAIFITDDWVVSIHGPKLIHCVSAMCLLINLVGQETNASVTIELLSPESRNENPLYRQLDRESRRTRIIGAIKWTLAVILSAAAGALLAWLLGGISP